MNKEKLKKFGIGFLKLLFYSSLVVGTVYYIAKQPMEDMKQLYSYKEVDLYKHVCRRNEGSFKEANFETTRMTMSGRYFKINIVCKEEPND